MVTSTCQGSIPFAPFAGSDMLVAAAALGAYSHYAQLILYHGVVWVNITSASNPAKLEPTDT